MRWTRPFEDVGMKDVALVGGKNASLGELIRGLAPLGVKVPGGFAVTAEGYRYFLDQAGLGARIREALGGLNKDDADDLARRAGRVREMILEADLPPDLQDEIAASYRALSRRYGEEATDVAVRSSATAEDLPNASFAGQQESFLNVRGARLRRRGGEEGVREPLHAARDQLPPRHGLRRRRRRALGRRAEDGALGPGERGRHLHARHRERAPGVVLVTSSWGLGESVVQGRVVPDLFHVHKATLREGFRPLVRKKLGTKEVRLVYDERAPAGEERRACRRQDRARFSLDGRRRASRSRAGPRSSRSTTPGCAERTTPMDIEWAKDGVSGELFVVQARPETVHSRKQRPHGAPLRAEGQGRAARVGARHRRERRGGHGADRPRPAADRRDPPRRRSSSPRPRTPTGSPS